MFRMQQAALALVSVFCAWTLQADQIKLKNGDTLTGTIVKKDGDKLTLKSEFLGEVTTPWSAVVEVRSDNPLYVILPGGKEVSGKIETAGSTLRIATTAQPESAPLAEVAAIRDSSEQAAYERLLHPGLTELWAGYFDLGLALARGNARTSTFTTSMAAARKTRTDNTRVYFNQIYSTATINRVSSNTAEAIRGGVAYDRNLGSRLFVDVFNDYEYDKFQNLDLRFVLGSGLGYHLIKSETTTLDALGGIAYNRESFASTPASPALTRSSAEGFFGDQLAYKLSGRTSLSQSFRLFTSVQDASQYRINFDLGTSTTLKKWLSLQITASDRYLNIPAAGRQKNDILLTTGFRVSFAR